MTCTGCENKLIRALQAIPSIHHIKTSLVLARAEFDYSGVEEDLKTLIEAIEKRTGFSAEEVAPASSHVLDLTVDATLMEKFCITETLVFGRLSFKVIDLLPQPLYRVVLRQPI